MARRWFAFPHRAEVAKAAKRHQVDPRLVAAVIYSESGHRPQVVSGVGAVGLMQLMPDTAQWIAKTRGLQVPEGYAALAQPATNIDLGTWYIHYLLRRYRHLDLALAAYNAGLGNVDEWIHGQEFMKNQKALYDPATMKVIRFPETAAFIERVKAAYWAYGWLYPEG